MRPWQEVVPRVRKAPRQHWDVVRQKLPTDPGAAREAAARLERRFTPDFRRSVVCAIGAIILLSVGGALGGVSTHSMHKRFAVIGLAVGFVVLGVLSVRSAGNQLARLVSSRGAASAAATVRLLVLLFGYVVVLIALFGLLRLPLGHLLVGGAITGIVVGIAAQQALGNVFAGLVLLLARPFRVGEAVRVRSGAMGGPFDGTVTGMDLLYTRILTDDGPVRLPNAGLLSAAIGPRPPRPPDQPERVPVSAGGRAPR